MADGAPVKASDVGTVLLVLMVGALAVTVLPPLAVLWAAWVSAKLGNTKPVIYVRAAVGLIAVCLSVGLAYEATRISAAVFGVSPESYVNTLHKLEVALFGWIGGFALVWGTFFATGGTGAEASSLFSAVRDRFSKTKGVKKAHVKGMQLLSLVGATPPNWINDGTEKPVSLGWVPYLSVDAETQHTQIEGSTGSGKSQAIKCLIAEAIERGDSIICVDGGRDLFNTFGKHAGSVTRFDLMDDQSVARWSPVHEIERAADWDHLATSIIGDGSGESAEWRNMAKALFSAVGEGYNRECKKADRPFSNREFAELLLAAPDHALAAFVAGTPAAALIGNEKGLSSVRMSLLSPMAFGKYLPELASDGKVGGFSAREWMRRAMKADAGQRALFLTFQKRDLSTCRNLIAAIIDLVISTAVDEGKGARRIWLIIDELAGLGEIPSLLMGAAELRKTGVRLVVGMQDFDQIENIYGRSRAASVTNNLSNKLVLRTTSGTSAERLSKMLGDSRLLVTNVSDSASTAAGSLMATQNTSGTSTSERDERVVMAAEILGLPDLVGFVKMSGENVIYKTPVPIFGGVVGSPLVEAPGAPSPSLVMRA